jgi:hypothetical protein
MTSVEVLLSVVTFGTAGGFMLLMVWMVARRP